MNPTPFRQISILLSGPGFLDLTNRKRKQLVVDLQVRNSDDHIFCGNRNEYCPFTMDNLCEALTSVAPVSTVINAQSLDDQAFVGTIATLKSRKKSHITTVSLSNFDELLTILKSSSKNALKLTLQKLDSTGEVEKYRTMDYPYSAPKGLIDLAKQLLPQLLTLRPLIIDKTGIKELPLGFFKAWSFDIASLQCRFPFFSHRLASSFPQIKNLVLEEGTNFNNKVVIIGTLVAKSVQTYVENLVDQIPKEASGSPSPEEQDMNSTKKLFPIHSDFGKLSNILRDFFFKLKSDIYIFSNLSADQILELEERFYTSGIFLGYSFHKSPLDTKKSTISPRMKRSLSGVFTPAFKRTRSNPTSIREEIQLNQIYSSKVPQYRTLSLDFQTEIRNFLIETKNMISVQAKNINLEPVAYLNDLKVLKRDILELFTGDI